MTCAPSQSRRCGWESQALIRYFSCALRLVWDYIRSVSDTRGEEPERDRRGNHRNRLPSLPVVGEGEFWRKVTVGGENTAKRCRRRSAGQEARKRWSFFVFLEGGCTRPNRSVLGLFYWWMCMHEFCIEWAQKPPQIRREYLPDRQASLPGATEEGEHREHPQSPARRGRLQNGRFATRQWLHGALF